MLLVEFFSVDAAIGRMSCQQLKCNRTTGVNIGTGVNGRGFWDELFGGEVAKGAQGPFILVLSAFKVLANMLSPTKVRNVEVRLSIVLGEEELFGSELCVKKTAFVVGFEQVTELE